MFVQVIVHLVIIFKSVLQSQNFDCDLNIIFDFIFIYSFIDLCSLGENWKFWVLWTEKLAEEEWKGKWVEKEKKFFFVAGKVIL